jgi:hypothetical protein
MMASWMLTARTGRDDPGSCRYSPIAIMWRSSTTRAPATTVIAS